MSSEDLQQEEENERASLDKISVVFGKLLGTCCGGVADTSSFEDDDSSEAEDS